MKRAIKIVLIIIGSLLVCYATYFIFDAVAYAYTLDWTNTPKKYLWLFRDSAKNKIDTNFRFSYIQKHDIYNHYIYDSKFNITIWEFKDLKNINLEKIPINLDKNLNNIVFGSGETINVGAIPEVTVKYGFNFHNSMNVNIGEGGIIDSSFKFNNYRGFYGSIHKMLCNYSAVKSYPQNLFLCKVETSGRNIIITQGECGVAQGSSILAGGDISFKRGNRRVAWAIEQG